ncbi:glycosyltransferase family 4 protein [Halobacillus karajensis]|uniref:GDP-mannose-dependent alpha-(1-6)-phosphatidylinositol monomannoside mannosyltransferase n=1 Tax=Halobacillus karajensis TaxID=195088 RepID=A0A059NYB1_9BACI|nr:glycosyltransferase family 4 protein [Halobacillus karajensis]CDQ18949.1 GDP-mannose-dependent alpha-(1-6)-phosphatidylinositol monomannoside mannosyltransferase [Halobacillus karajensis]CDQ22977.1 GDP-mannose-dependent alpha-(1-6)-phosphatidylinositol monomannoside mannosyltransferase [Halobacillus karajensis]CDQ26460.1 GDP-mannose-dependent alpha-(1-6)-phosphatidylinositol monomannoside mannosyltransferase [Halobacillus karajensis]
MKICHVTSVHSYNDIRIAIKECTSLADTNRDVHLIAPNTDTKSFNGFKVYGVKNRYSGRIKRFRNFSNDIYLEALKVDADIYHFHDPELIPIGLKLKKQNKKVVYDIHEDVPRQILTKHWIPKPLRKLISYAFEIYENQSVKKLDGLVTATPFIKKRFKKYNKNTIDVNNYPIMKELYVSSSSNCNKDNTVVYIGGISKERGSYSMVKAIGKTETTLTLAGNFRDEREEVELKMLDEWEKVNFLGYLDRKEIKGLLETALAGLVVLEPRTNFIDSLPIKMFEYMATGLPVIASNFPLWKEIIEGNNCGICVDPLNTDEIANAIQWIKDNPIKAAEMGENGKKAIKEHYNWESESKKLQKFYDDLLKPRNLEKN